jgi:tetratricopeptide (TPR) repeat protein
MTAGRAWLVWALVLLPALATAQGRYTPQGATQRSFQEGERRFADGTEARERGDENEANRDFEAALDAFQEAARADPRFTEAAAKVGLLAYSLGRPEEAVPLLRASLEREPRNHELMYWLGNNLLRAGYAEEALTNLERVAAESESFPEVHLVLGQHHYKTRDYARARPSLERFVRVRPEDMAARGLLGNTYFKLKAYREALAEFAAVRAREPDNLGVQVNIGNAHYRLGDYERAVATLEAVLEKDPDRASVFFNLAQSYFKLERYEDALKQYRRFLETKPRSFNGHYFAGSALMALGRDQLAIESLETAATLKPKIAQPHYKIGVLHLKRRRTAQARAAFDEAARRAPKDAWVISAQGTVARQNGDLVAAEARHREAAEARPESARLHANLAVTLFRAGRLDDAEAAIKAGLERDNMDPWIRQAAATILSAQLAARLSAGDADAAVKLGETVARLRPDDARLRANLALALVAAGRGPEAEEAAATAVRMPDAPPVARYALGRAQVANGKIAEGGRACAAAYELAPGPDYAACAGGAALRGGSRDAALTLLDIAHAKWPDHEALRINRALARFDRYARGEGERGDVALALAVVEKLPAPTAARVRYAAALNDLRRGDGKDALVHLGALATLLDVVPKGERVLKVRATRPHLDLLEAWGLFLQNRHDRVVAILGRSRAARRARNPEGQLLRGAHEMLAYASYRNGQVRDAGDHLRAAKRVGASATVDHNIAVTDYEGGKRTPAERRFKKLQSNVPEARFNLAVALDNRGDHRGAYTLYRAYARGKGAYSKRAGELADVKLRIFGFE